MNLIDCGKSNVVFSDIPPLKHKQKIRMSVAAAVCCGNKAGVLKYPNLLLRNTFIPLERISTTF